MKNRVDRSLQAAAPGGAAKPLRENLDDLLHVEPLSIEVGVGLISFIADGAESPLLRRIGGIRKQLATELGFIIPAIRVTDNLALRAREYLINVKGVAAGDRVIVKGHTALPDGAAVSVTP